MVAQMEMQIVDALQSVYNELGWLGVAIIMILEYSIGITPGEVVLVLAGWLLIDARGLPFSVVLWGSLAGALGSVIGASVPYWMARIGGRPIVEKVAGWVRLDLRHIERVENLTRRWGAGFVLIGRLTPGMRTVVSIPAGIAPIPFIKFASATFIGTYIWCVFFIGLGFTFGHKWRLASELVKEYAPFALIIGLAAGSIFLIWQYWLRKKITPVRIRSK